MNDYEKLYEKYKKAATKYVIKNLDSPSDHLINVATSVMLHRDNHLRGGDFVTAICENNLKGAIGRADDEMINHLKLLVMVLLNCIPDEW
jgi:hypothetical protein